MGHFVTFFRNRDLDSGREQKVRMTGQQGTFLLHVYTRARVDLSPFNDRVLHNQGETKTAFADLQRLIGSQGGGIIASASDTDAQVTLIAGQGFQMPASYVLLRPGFPPEAVAASQDRVPLPEAGHLIVPIDKTAQSELEEMLKFLRWHSPDVESQVLNAIRQPSLDARVADLEDRSPERERSTRLHGSAAAKKSGRFHRYYSWGMRTLSDTKLGGPLLTALLLAALLLNFFILDSRLTGLEEGVASLQAKAGIVPSPPPDGDDPENDGGDDPENDGGDDPENDGGDDPENDGGDDPENDGGETIQPTLTGSLPKQLILAVRARAPNEPASAAGVLWRTHFATINDIGRLNEWTEAQQKTLYTNSTFLWGAMKLAMAQAGVPASNLAYLNATNEISATKNALRDIKLESFDQKTIDMFAACGCRLFSQRKPAIPTTRQGANLEFSFAAGDCTSFKDAQIDAGLELILQKLGA